MRTVPDEGSRSQARMRSVVVLPGAVQAEQADDFALGDGEGEGPTALRSP